MSDPNLSWRPVAGWEGFYEVSSDGQIWSRPRERTRGGILKPGVAGDGYLYVRLCRPGRRHARMIHLLVLEAFAGPRPDPPPGCKRIDARHLDGNRLNNSITNLAWGTHSENQLDRVRHGADPNASKTHCNRGHEFTPENTYNYRRRRYCRTCCRERDRKSYWAEKERNRPTC
jgi:NUMOD4 motif/HNH endonuclease